MNWIKLSDRRPDPYEQVLVTDGENIEDATYIATFKKWDGIEKVREEYITHWMPLPEIPNYDPSPFNAILEH